MKNTLRNLSSLTFLGVMLFTANIASAQTSAVSTTTSTSATQCAGTVSQFGPDTIVVSSTTSPTPVSYSYSKTTTYVDQNGNPVSVETVKSGMPVTVYYTQDGDKMVASKVVVQSTTGSSDGSAPSTVETKKTTTTTTPAP